MARERSIGGMMISKSMPPAREEALLSLASLYPEAFAAAAAADLPTGQALRMWRGGAVSFVDSVSIPSTKAAPHYPGHCR